MAKPKIKITTPQVIKYTPPPPAANRPAMGGPNVTGAPPPCHDYHGSSMSGQGNDGDADDTPIPATGYQQVV